jgi:hypothetical protein
MTLLYKPDWEETKPRYLAWWAHEALDRCGLAVCAPRAGCVPGKPPVRPATPEERWTNLDYLAACNEFNHSRTYYGGEAFPCWNGGYAGHTGIPAFLGCPAHLDWHTGWWDPILAGEDLDFRGLTIDRQGRWWQFTLALLRRAAKESAGKSIPGVGAFGGCGDTLAGLRSTERLLFDVMDRPDQVRAAEEYLMTMWCEVYDAFYEITREAAQGSTCFFNLWSPGKFYCTHNDFSYMISPKMFRDIFLPVIERQTRFLDHNVYHVDGIGAFAHVPALCELPRIQAIQILPGAGKPSPLHYLDTLKYVQRAGKNLHITIPSREVEPALKELSARGLFIETWCDSEAEARTLLENAKKWSHDRG